MIFLLTDTHFFHDQMVNFCGRPVNHTEIIKNNLFHVGFTPEDILIHLGDICIGHDIEVHETIIKPLKCKKWLLRGNHDRKSDAWYLNHGWDFVGDRFTGTYFGKKICFSHRPVAYDGEYDYNIHGHYHNNTHRMHEPELMAIANERQRLLAIENTSLSPIPLKTFLKEL